MWLEFSIMIGQPFRVEFQKTWNYFLMRCGPLQFRAHHWRQYRPEEISAPQCCASVDWSWPKRKSLYERQHAG